MIGVQKSDSSEEGWASTGFLARHRASIVWVGGIAVAGAFVFLLILADSSYKAAIAQPPYDWDFGVVSQYFPQLLAGFELTLIITVLSMAFGMVLGIFVAFARLSRMPVLRVLVTGYIEIMRGTPVLVQLVWVFYAFPVLTAIQLTGPEAVILALSLNTAAFYGEAFRSGIQAVPHAQTESADVLGLSYFQRMRYVVVPQAARIVLPVLISTSISLFKDTSLVSTIGVQDMMYQGLIVSEATYRPLEILTTIAVMYFVVAFPVTIIMRRIEIHVNRHLAR